MSSFSAQRVAPHCFVSENEIAEALAMWTTTADLFDGDFVPLRYVRERRKSVPVLSCDRAWSKSGACSILQGTQIGHTLRCSLDASIRMARQRWCCSRLVSFGGSALVWQTYLRTFAPQWSDHKRPGRSDFCATL